MLKHIPIKNHTQEIQLVSQRSVAILTVMAILVLLLILRLAYLQLAQHDVYTTLSQQNSFDLVPLEPTRGLIYDRRGVLIAENIPVFSLDVLPYKVTNLPKALTEMAKIISLSDIEIAQFQKQLKQHRRFDEIPLKLRLSEVEVAKFSENAYRFSGFSVHARLIRHYPLGSALSHVLGYVGRINTEELEDIDTSNYSATNYIGKLGIEKFYEEELHGTVGYEQAENDASGEPIRITNRIKPTHGKNLFLTIDSRLQIAAEKALAGNRGAIVAIQPSTGQVLAIVSQPSYDPNLFVAGISNHDFQTLQQSPDRPLYNRALRGLYPLASTIKPFIALQGLSTGITTPNFTIFDPGWYKLKNSSHLFHDWRHHGHGTINLTRAITSSCDTYFYDLANKLGIQRIDDILSQFGFGELTGIDLGEELPGIIASPQWKRHSKGMPWYEGDTLISGIGQGYMQATPLQLASAIATLATSGKRFAPYLLLETEEPGKITGTTINQQLPTPLNTINLTDNNYWQIIITAMQNVITSPEGTGFHHFGRPSYSVAAKTGTAQVYSFSKRRRESNDDYDNQEKLPEKLRDHSLLIGFAPVEKPEIAIAVIVENSKLASSIARQVLDYYLLELPKSVNNNQQYELSPFTIEN
jgi:penicillin-binding protein 2